MLLFFLLFNSTVLYNIIFKEIYLKGTLTVTITTGESQPGSDRNEGALHTPQISRIGV